MDSITQLMLRAERDAEAERRAYVVYKDDLADKNPVRSPKKGNFSERFKLFRRQRHQRPYECA